MNRKMIDLEEVLERKRALLDEAEEACRGLADEAVEEYGDFAHTPEAVRSAHESLDAQRREREAEVAALDAVVSEHDDTSFELKQLSGGEVANIEDEVRDASFEFDSASRKLEGTPQSGYSDVLWTRRSVTRAPDWLDDSPECKNDPANLAPWKAFDVLSEMVDDYNTLGDATPGNLSLRERMRRNES